MGSCRHGGIWGHFDGVGDLRSSGSLFHCSLEPQVQEDGRGARLTGHVLGEQSHILQVRACVLVESFCLNEVRADVSGV